jgi:hypothetical protein
MTSLFSTFQSPAIAMPPLAVSQPQHPAHRPHQQGMGYFSHRPSHAGPQLLVEGLQKGRQEAECRHHRWCHLNAPQSNYFQLECVGKIYAMRYDAVYLYADVNHDDYKKFTLPPDALANRANKDVIAPVQKKRNKHSTWRLDNNDDDDDDNDNDDYFATPKKRNNNAGKRKHKKRKTTINHDFVLGAEFGNEGTADVDNEEGGDDNMDNDDGPMGEPPKKYGMTMAKDWTMHN